MPSYHVIVSGSPYYKPSIAKLVEKSDRIVHGGFFIILKVKTGKDLCLSENAER